MGEGLLRTLIMTIFFTFIGVCLLIWLYLFVSAIGLRISTRGETDEICKQSYDRIFTSTLEKDLKLIHRSTRIALLMMGVFLVLIWLFGATAEQSYAKRMMEECDCWVCYLIGGGIAIGTLLLLAIPSFAQEALSTARLIRRESIKNLWIAVFYFVITWLIA